MSPPRVLALAGRILRQFRHDRRTVGLIVIVPIVVMALIGYLISDDKEPLPVGVVNLDQGVTTPNGTVALGDRIVEALRKDTTIQIRALTSDAAAKDRVREGEVAAAVVLPADLTQDAMSQQFTIEVSITDANHQEVSAQAEVIAGESAVGGGSLPGEVLPTRLVAISTSSAEGLVKFQDPYFFIKRQLLLGVLPGLLLFYLTSRLDYHFWQKAARPLFYLSLLLLILVLVPGIGGQEGTPKSRFVIKGLSFQLAEFFKFALIIYFAAWLKERPADDFFGWRPLFLRFLILVAIFSALLLKQPDLGTLMILLLIAAVMYFIAGGRLFHLLGLAGAGAIGAVLLVLTNSYQRLSERLTIFLNPTADPQGLGYHIAQALLAIGSGGFFGLGWGHSRQKFQYLPEVRADSIFAIIGEELGFFVSVLFILFLIFIFWRGLKIAINAPDNFGKLIVVGAMIWLAGQSFVNIASMIGLLPLTGLPLPLVSHGGSAMAIILALLGVVVNVSRQTKQI